MAIMFLFVKLDGEIIFGENSIHSFQLQFARILRPSQTPAGLDWSLLVKKHCKHFDFGQNHEKSLILKTQQMNWNFFIDQVMVTVLLGDVAQLDVKSIKSKCNGHFH